MEILFFLPDSYPLVTGLLPGASFWIFADIFEYFRIFPDHFATISVSIFAPSFPGPQRLLAGAARIVVTAVRFRTVD